MRAAMAASEPIPRAPGGEDYEPAAVRRRQELCERLAGRALPHLAGRPVPPAEAHGKVENLIGFAQVPIGLAGPLALETSRGPRVVHVPMATTEGALVASHSRGMKVLSEAGGARTSVLGEVLSQHPVLVFPDARGAQAAARTAREMRAELERLAGSVTRHGRLVEIEPEAVGRRLVLRLGFATGDAIGINMAAHAAELCSRALAERTGARERYVHGEDVEKRSRAGALREGRGRSAVADAVVPRAVLARSLRVRPEDLVAIQRTYAVGFARLATPNWLVQSANGLAAVYLACGQDVAYVAESAAGLLDLDLTDDGDLYASAWLPSLLVGTVGGGSGQGTAAECLDVLGVRGAGGAGLFAEILAATVLAGDLSLLASFCTHEFVAAHERLGRNRPAERAE
jgi:hydroxymethylglutaryl-CoA reductase (NADPH)